MSSLQTHTVENLHWGSAQLDDVSGGEVNIFNQALTCREAQLQLQLQPDSPSWAKLQ